MNLTSRIKITKEIKEYDVDTSAQIDAMMAEQMNLFHTVFNKAWFAFMAEEEFSNKEIHQFDNSTYLEKHGYSFNTKYAYSIARDAVDKAKMAYESYKYQLDDIDKRIKQFSKNIKKDEKKLNKLLKKYKIDDINLRLCLDIPLILFYIENYAKHNSLFLLDQYDVAWSFFHIAN